eukprot:3201769-Amphidinium_carterae.1
MVTVCSLPVPRSLAATFKIPLASISNVTSIWGTPLGAGGTPSRRKVPRILLSLANCRSPCNTTISTDGWESTAVENTSRCQKRFPSMPPLVPSHASHSALCLILRH